MPQYQPEMIKKVIEKSFFGDGKLMQFYVLSQEWLNPSGTPIAITVVNKEENDNGKLYHLDFLKDSENTSLSKTRAQSIDELIDAARKGASIEVSGLITRPDDEQDRRRFNEGYMIVTIPGRKKMIYQYQIDFTSNHSNTLLVKLQEVWLN